MRRNVGAGCRAVQARDRPRLARRGALHGHALTELTTSLSNFVVPDADLANYGVGANDFFSLQFTLSGPTLAWGSCNVDTGCDVRGFNDAANFPPTFVITEVSVPEPGTPLLAGLALLMMAAFGLRSRARRAG